MPRNRSISGLFCLIVAVAATSSAPASVALYDTTAQSAQPISGEALATRANWLRVPVDTTDHAFKGDHILINGRVALVLRAKGNGAELYSIEPQGIMPRCVLRPAAAAPAQLVDAKVTENSDNAVSLAATFRTADGKSLNLRYELKIGQIFVQITPDESAKAVRIEAPCRFAVMPDFFADDIVVDARTLRADTAELPSDNFFLHLLGKGDAIAMAVWNDRENEVSVTLAGNGPDRRIASTDIPCGNKGKVWLAVLAQPAVWHVRDIALSQAGSIIPLDWKAPMPAIWRIDWRRDDQLADSWEMLWQRRSGDFMKQGIVGSADTIPANRRRWNTVLGTFPYPCWIDQESRAFLQPLKSKVRFAGPAIIYPLGRSSATPLDAFTVVDIVRATLGVGPCEYILDVEGQQSQYKGRATCANRDTLNPIYQRGQQLERRAEVERSLTEVLVFIRHIRSRIEGYRQFGQDVLSYLSEQKKIHPELEKPLSELESLAKAIEARFAARRGEIKTPEEAAAMIEAFRKDGMNDQGPGAYEKCRKFTASIVEIGGSQDELVGECRLAVRILRQRAGTIVTEEPRLADVAREIRSRSQKVLRSPANHEGARH